MNAISNEMVRVYKERFGRGPTLTRTTWAGPDVLLVTLEDNFTAAELHLQQMGEPERRRELRMLFQQEWTHAAYNPRTRLFYVPVIESCANFRTVPVKYKEGLPYYGGEAETHRDHAGAVKAFDPMTGNEAWRWENDEPMVASVLTTGGDLVFAGEPTGEFNAYDARNGKRLWSHQTGGRAYTSSASPRGTPSAPGQALDPAAPAGAAAATAGRSGSINPHAIQPPCAKPRRRPR